MSNRDSQGRFLPGGPGGPGRPARTTEDEYLAAMADVVDVNAWRSIVVRAKEDALAGCSKAREWLSGYLLGKPVSRSEISVGTHADHLEEAKEAVMRDPLYGAEHGTLEPLIVDDSYIQRVIERHENNANTLREAEVFMDGK